MYSFFSSYSLGANGWNYVLGQFASESLPFSDNVTLIVLREGKAEPDTFTVSNPGLFRVEFN